MSKSVYAFTSLGSDVEALGKLQEAIKGVFGNDLNNPKRRSSAKKEKQLFLHLLPFRRQLLIDSNGAAKIDSSGVDEELTKEMIDAMKAILNCNAWNIFKVINKLALEIMLH